MPASMISAYERDQRQPTLATLLKLLKAAGFEVRFQLAPYDDHDDVLADANPCRVRNPCRLDFRRKWMAHGSVGAARPRQGPTRSEGSSR